MAEQKVFGFAGWSGSGKTTVIEKLISHLSASGLRVSLVKHAHHDFDLDLQGKDSYRHRHAGAGEVLVTSAKRFAIVRELRGAAELDWREAVFRLSRCDLVLVEGFKRAPIPKLEIWRAAVEKPLLFPTDSRICGICTDDPLPLGLPAPGASRFGFSETEAIAEFVLLRAETVLD